MRRLKAVEGYYVGIVLWALISVVISVQLKPSSFEDEASIAVSALLVSIGSLLYVETTKGLRDSHRRALDDIRRSEAARETPRQYAHSHVVETAETMSTLQYTTWDEARVDLYRQTKAMAENQHLLLRLLYTLAIVQIGSASFLMLTGAASTLASFVSAFAEGSSILTFVLFSESSGIILEIGIPTSTRNVMQNASN